MLRIYDGEVFVIDMEEYERNIRQTLENIMKNPDYAKMLFLLKKEGEIIAAVNMVNLMKHQIISKTFSDRQKVFIEARDYCVANSVPHSTCFPVLDEAGECVYLLCYMENRIYTKYFPQGRLCQPLYYDLESNGENLDYSLVEQADVYIFSELEEYTYAIALLLAKIYPHKTLLMFDEKAAYFPELSECTVYVEPGEKDIFKRFYKKHCLWITSDGVNHSGFPFEYLVNIYNSINVLYSIVWCQKREHFGEKNKDCVIYLADFPGTEAGLVDYIRFTYEHYLMAKKHGWKFCIDLSRRPNQYLVAEGENMWDYFFESLSDVSVEETYESFSVIRAYENNISLYSVELLPYMRKFYDSDKRAVIKTIRFNKETKKKIDELMPEILKRDNRVLGVILRGTDYREEANKCRNMGVETAGVEKMIAKCKFIMEIYGYTHIFIATEDSEYFQRVREEFGDRCLSIEQNRGYHDYSSGYKPLADVLQIENGKEFGRRYLAVIQSLANCRSLIANMQCGAAWAAEDLNDSKYEYFEVVDP